MVKTHGGLGSDTRWWQARKPRWCSLKRARRDAMRKSEDAWQESNGSAGRCGTDSVVPGKVP